MTQPGLNIPSRGPRGPRINPRASRPAAWVALFVGLFTSSAVQGAEIASNAVGGGAWTDPATWRGKKVPGPDDDVVVQKNDVVLYDRAGDEKPACRKLLIDPKGGLTFKTNAGRLVLAVSEGVESYGVIRVDGTKSAGDDFELRLVGDAKEKRQVKLHKGAALLLYGRAELPKDRRNVAVVSPQPADAKEPVPGLVDADGGVMIDWQRGAVHDVKLVARKVDNTGAKPNERLKVSECRFTGAARFWCQGCDTPEIHKNTFDNPNPKAVDEAAISVSYSPLVEIKDNVVRGGFPVGITINYENEPVLVGNVVEKCGVGIQGGQGVQNMMLKQTTIRDCPVGLRLEGATGVLEEITVERAATAFHVQNSNLQLTSFRAAGLDKKGTAILLETGTLSLLNCDLKPDQITAKPQAAPAGKPALAAVTGLQYLVVGAKGAPPGSLVEVRTASPAPPPGAADPNVRNSPAPLVDGQTPSPRTLNPLIVKSWSIDFAGKVQPGPDYAVKLLGPAAKEGADRPVLTMTTFRPRPAAVRTSDDKTPTLEVSVK